VNARWALESSLDVQWAHAIAPRAKIILVEAASSSYEEVLSAAYFAAETMKADVVSMSFGGDEWSEQASASRAYFADMKATFVAASGDAGHGILYPAASPHVLAVGGTRLAVDSAGIYQGEIAWQGSGGGLSAYENASPYFWPGETPVSIVNAWSTAAAPGGRPVPDVAYNADPGIGFFVYADAYFGAGYYGVVGGTSAGTPQWAAIVAIANAMRLEAGKEPFDSIQRPEGQQSMRVQTALSHLSAGNGGAMAYAALFNDVTQSGNGDCGLLCNAAAGRDLVTGIGTPNAAKLIPALVAY
jgi:subtilase family serine protease